MFISRREVSRAEIPPHHASQLVHSREQAVGKGQSSAGPPPDISSVDRTRAFPWTIVALPPSVPVRTGAIARRLSPCAATRPPRGQPALKSYLQFNEGWPANSWEVTEPSTGYQASSSSFGCLCAVMHRTSFHVPLATPDGSARRCSASRPASRHFSLVTLVKPRMHARYQADNSPPARNRLTLGRTKNRR